MKIRTKCAILLAFIFTAQVSLASAQEEIWVSSQKRQAALVSLASDPERAKCSENCVHKIVEEYQVNLSHGRQIILIAASAEKKCTCPSCAAQLSFFFYEEIENEWSLVHSHYAFIKWGTWGGFPEDISIRKIGDDKAAIFLEKWIGDKGYYGSVVEAYSLADDKFDKILNYCSSSSNVQAVGDDANNAYNWETYLDYTPKSGSVADITIELTDHADGNHTETRFVYDGKKYLPVNADQRILPKCK